MNIAKVIINGLFGHFNYVIDMNKPLTLMHGPNGCGKTTILRMINSLFNGRSEVLRSIEFEKMTIEFDTGTVLSIIRKLQKFDDTKIHDEYWTLEFKLCIDGVETTFDKNDSTEEFYRYVRRNGLPPYIHRISDDQWKDIRRDVLYTTQELINNFGSRIMRFVEGEGYIPAQVEEILKSIDVAFISSDRLTVQKRIERSYGEDSIKVEQRVDLIAKKLSELMGEAIQKYAQISQSKDRTFPVRAIHETNPMTVDQIKEKLTVLEMRRKELIKNGILEEEYDIDVRDIVDSITDKERSILSLYAVDTEEKLNVLAELSASINLFRRIIETNFSNKKMIFTQKEGFYFESEFDGRKIKANSLSSGEQHELVMFFDSIFETHDNTVVLIDEPELSLHIKWQLGYISELRNIIQLSKFRALIATHSPQIIHGNWDITTSLAAEE